MLKVFNIIGVFFLVFTGVYFLFSNEMVEGFHYGIMVLCAVGHWIINIMRNGKD